MCPLPGPSVTLPKTPMGVVGDIQLGITEMTQNVIVLAHPSVVLQERVMSSVVRAKQRRTDSNMTRTCSVQNVVCDCHDVVSHSQRAASARQIVASDV